MEAFLGLVAEGKVTPKRLVTHRYTISEAEKAYALLESGAPHLAILISYPEVSPSRLERQIRLATPPRRHDGNRVAFIGFGNYAKSVLLPAVREAGGVSLTSVVTATGISAAHAASRHGFAVAATEAPAAFDDADTDTIFIATRHDTHAALTAAALRAGKNVFCEKPLAIDAAGLAEVVAAAESTSGILTIGFNRRFAPLLRKAKTALETRAGPLVMSYRVNAGPIPKDSWIQREEGAGRVIGEVCHFVDALTYLASSRPIEAQAIAVRDHADAVSILIRFADGSTGSIVYTSLGDAAVPKEYLEIFADGVVIQLDDYRRLTVTRRGEGAKSKRAQDKGQRALVSAFLEATRGSEKPPIPFEDIVTVTETTFAIEEAIRSGRAVAIAVSSR